MALITADSWGSITVRGKTYKDVVIHPDKCFEWDWRHDPYDPMRHNPGIRTYDLDRLILLEKPDAVVLSRGRDLVLQVNPQLRDYLLGNGVKHVYIQETSDAIRTVNRLVSEGVRVAALIHTTC